MSLKVDTIDNTVYLIGSDRNGYFINEPLTLTEAYDLAVKLLLAVQQSMEEIT